MGLSSTPDATRRCKAIVAEMRAQSDPAIVAGRARFGISPEGGLGLSIPALRAMGKRIGRDHDLAESLWATGLHEARILASLVGDPARLSRRQMETWALEFDSWGVCDQVCSNLFDRTPFAADLAMEWSRRPEEFVKRAGFVLMAVLAVHDKAAADAAFRPMLAAVRRDAADERNFVRKAVNWALRQIGKRNAALNREAIAMARQVAEIDSKAARWIAADALRELQSEPVQARLRRKG
jgi:3-methyladenine DNA glycosylase AlkD